VSAFSRNVVRVTPERCPLCSGTLSALLRNRCPFSAGLRSKHHDSALCHVAATLATRIAACWRRREHYALRDVDGRLITETEARAIVAERYKVPDEVRQARRRANRAKQLKGRTGRRSQKSTEAAPAAGSSTTHKPTRPKKVA